MNNIAINSDILDSCLISTKVRGKKKIEVTHWFCTNTNQTRLQVTPRHWQCHFKLILIYPVIWGVCCDHNFIYYLLICKVANLYGWCRDLRRGLIGRRQGIVLSDRYVLLQFFHSSWTLIYSLCPATSIKLHPYHAALSLQKSHKCLICICQSNLCKWKQTG